MRRRGLPCYFSFDNDHIQKYADLRSMGIQPWEKMPLAPYSPDCHKVIEHFFHRLECDLWESIYSEGGVYNGITLQQRAEQVFWRMRPEPIADDCSTLPLTYKVINTPANQQFWGENGVLHTGVGGDWPPRAYR